MVASFFIINLLSLIFVFWVTEWRHTFMMTIFEHQHRLDADGLFASFTNKRDIAI